NGYAYFTGSYFDKLEIDTSRRAGYADVFLSILPAQREDAYARYRVGQVTVLSNFSPLDAERGPARLDTMIDGVRFLTNEEEFRMRPGLLRRNIFLQPGGLYSRDELEKTNLALNGLGIYRFVRINPLRDTTGQRVINYQIQLPPRERMSIGADLDFNYTNRNGNVGAGNLLGVSVSPSFQNRNLLGGAELLVTSLRAGVEINPFPNDSFPLLSTVDLGIDVSLYLPRFKDFGIYGLLNKIPAPWGGGRVISDNFLGQLRERASSRYSLGYEFLLISQFYSYTIFNARLGYDFRRSTTSNYRINHLAIDVLDPSTEPRFKAILDENQFLDRSFGEQFFFSALFRELEYTRNGRSDRKGRSVALTGSFELAGAEVFLANRLFAPEQVWTPRDGATFAKYALGFAEIRYNKQYTPENSFAGRFIFGVARPYGGRDTVGVAVPYVKQFFVGGANSMRAWAPRGLGPGGYVDPLSLSTDNNLRLFQTGDLRLELNLEYRFPLTSLFKLALFADIGNIWALSPDEQRPGADFRWRPKARSDGFVHQPFYRQLAVGMGTGLRVDLSYFIFRLDASLPMRYNYPQDGFGEPVPLADRLGSFPERDYWRSFGRFRLRDLTFQLGLGYPF
ncbi:MAG: BamA/TamA family outer membrane protein, partial [Bacteroidota bacterium]